VLVYKSLHGLAPPYLSDDCQLVTDVGRRHLRSSDVSTRVLSHGHSHRLATRVLCSRTAAMEQPTNRDPEERHYVRTFSTITQCVFVRLGCDALWLLLKCAGYKHSYSLTTKLLGIWWTTATSVSIVNGYVLPVVMKSLFHVTG